MFVAFLEGLLFLFFLFLCFSPRLLKYKLNDYCKQCFKIYLSWFPVFFVNVLSSCECCELFAFVSWYRRVFAPVLVRTSHVRWQRGSVRQLG